MLLIFVLRNANFVCHGWRPDIAKPVKAPAPLGMLPAALPDAPAEFKAPLAAAPSGLLVDSARRQLPAAAQPLIQPPSVLKVDTMAPPKQPPTAEVSPAAAVNSSSHPIEHQAFRRACKNSIGKLADAWTSGGSKRMRTFATFVDSGCNTEATEAMIASEVAKSQHVRWEGEYLEADAILKELHFDVEKTKSFIARKRTEQNGMIIDPNDGVTEKFVWASSQTSTTSTSQKETMATRAPTELNATLLSKMIGMSSTSALSDAGRHRPTFNTAQGSSAGTVPQTERVLSKSPSVKKAKLAPQVWSCVLLD